MLTGSPATPTSPGQTVRAAAFRLLYATGAPVSTAAIAGSLDRPEDGVRSEVADLEGRGMMRLDAGGDVVGACGLSLVETVHEVRVDGRRFWTWCAYDAVGILGAVGRGGTMLSTEPGSGRLMEVRFEGGRPADEGPAIFVAEQRECRSVIDEWCPLNNVFESVEAAERWASENGVAGSAVPIREATAAAGDRWRRLFEAERPSPA